MKEINGRRKELRLQNSCKNNKANSTNVKNKKEKSFNSKNTLKKAKLKMQE